MRQYKGNLVLLLTAIIWGTSFVGQKVGMDYVGPFTFGGSRFLLGALVLIPVIIIFDAINKRKATTIVSDSEKHKFKTKDLLVGGGLCGVTLFLAASAQQCGIVYTTAGKAGFITALYIVLVPLLGIFMHKKVGIITWAGVGIAVLGLYLLTIQEGLSMQIGDAIVLIGTIFWALQIIIVDVYVDRVDGIKLSCIQFITAGILSTFAAFIFEEPTISGIVACSSTIIYMGVMVVGVAYTLQIIGQKYTKPTPAAIILSMESVFAVISGAILLNETMTARELTGCVLMFAAVVLTQIKPQELVAFLRKKGLTKIKMQ